MGYEVVLRGCSCLYEKRVSIIDMYLIDDAKPWWPTMMEYDVESGKP